MAFPVPKDVRAGRDFELIKGIPELIREDVKIKNTAEAFDLGEPVKFEVNSGVREAVKLVSGDTAGVPTKICWTLHREDDTFGGQSDVQATNQLTVLSGQFQAATTKFAAAGSYDPGDFVLGHWDAVALEPRLLGVAAGAITVAQLAIAVGRVLGVLADGRLHFESMAY